MTTRSLALGVGFFAILTVLLIFYYMYYYLPSYFSALVKNEPHRDNLVFMASEPLAVRKIKWIQKVQEYLKLSSGLDPKYGTHTLPLLAAAMATDGDILEMGCGYHSTPILDQISTEMKRFVLTTETDMAWMEKFLYMRSSYHEFQHVPVYEAEFNPSAWDQIGGDKKWSVAFVDHRPGERRVVDIQRLRNFVDIMVIHDTETREYRYEPTLSTFLYRHTCTEWPTYTTIVSDTKNNTMTLIRVLLDWSLELARQLPASEMYIN